MSHYEQILRERVRQALHHLLQLESRGYARELARILRDIANELDPPGRRSGGE